MIRYESSRAERVALLVESSIAFTFQMKILMDGWMDGLGLYVLFNSISVILGEWKGEHKGLCTMNRHLGSEKISPPAGLEPKTPVI